MFAISRAFLEGITDQAEGCCVERDHINLVFASPCAFPTSSDGDLTPVIVEQVVFAIIPSLSYAMPNRSCTAFTSSPSNA